MAGPFRVPSGSQLPSSSSCRTKLLGPPHSKLLVHVGPYGKMKDRPKQQGKGPFRRGKLLGKVLPKCLADRGQGHL